MASDKLSRFATQCIQEYMLSLFIIGGIFCEDTVDIYAFHAAHARNKHIDQMAFRCASSLGAYFIGFSHDATIGICRSGRNVYRVLHICRKKANR